MASALTVEEGNFDGDREELFCGRDDGGSVGFFVSLPDG